MEESNSARLLRQIKEVCEIAGIKTEEYAKVAKKRMDVLSLTRELGRERAALGERVYDLARRGNRTDILGDVTVQAIMGRIANLEVSLTSCEQEISTIHDSANVRTGDVRRKYDEPGATRRDPGGPGEFGEDEAVDAAQAAAREAEAAGAMDVDEPGPPAGTGGDRPQAR